jgi:hypothetical protein
MGATERRGRWRRADVRAPRTTNAALSSLVTYAHAQVFSHATPWPARLQEEHRQRPARPLPQ